MSSDDSSSDSDEGIPSPTDILYDLLPGLILEERQRDCADAGTLTVMGEDGTIDDAPDTMVELAVVARFLRRVAEEVIALRDELSELKGRR